ncbi:bifunctional hydroxymethylpyrimidine kinase/phosphomethylpyrimidine kinase [Rubellicoccus peritrichatus]|uniref:hydroxymethylpyrimidine kinase n=1 Tax=Rubellicoccus peritrichatus TaxID=3080537 RepID=A0AAQ3L7J4_9BACT|nr:bifunctional hydroxymethylpyrimidine kinase/phosphomethylpyrimidine kinase [Puniceicoccus sp. CR14]WOO40700.1 bifunctional hydroxymethylpyrimidine kinase/phosphomethylpyrimidine kinase [Puniceicoccus sp. CR14]
MTDPTTPVALSIATSDSGAGAGIQADLKTFSARDVYGVTAFAALTAQNPNGVAAIEALSPAFLQSQLNQLQTYYEIGAAKTGMLFSAPLIKQTAKFIHETDIPVVVDPVMVATSGATLLQPDAIEIMKSELLPLATLVTPNLDEAGVLLGQRPKTKPDMMAAGRQLIETYGVSFLLKGGHLEGNELVDMLFLKDQKKTEPLIFTAQRNPNVNTHGSGCTLSAAIAAELAKGHSLPEAVGEAHAYLKAAIQNPLTIGETNFIRH